MPTVPKNPLDKVRFYEAHLDAWMSSAVLIGTSTAEVSALETRAQAARDAFSAQQAAWQSARSATATFHNAVAAMANAGAGIISQIRAKAESTNNPNVYVLSHISPPAARTPMAPPGKPDGFKVELQVIGALTVKWKCPNPAGSSGTIYQVWRRIGAGDFQYVTSVGSKQFIDATIPPGTSSITYQVQAFRSTAAGPKAQFNVNFGIAANGAALATVTVSTRGKQKIAA
jgi:hypothetical protein